MWKYLSVLFLCCILEITFSSAHDVKEIVKWKFIDYKNLPHPSKFKFKIPKLYTINKVFIK